MRHLLQDLTLLLLVSLPINIFFHRIKLPSIMGFLIAGILIGPNSLGLIGDTKTVEELAEIGVVLLLFVVGLEFSIGRLLKNLKTVIGFASLQMLLTILVFFFVLWKAGLPGNQSLVFGILIALSSTAIVLKIMTDRGEINSLHGGICVGALLFQDLCVVPLTILIPILAVPEGGYSGMQLGLAFAKSIAAVASIFIFSRLLIPKMLEFIAHTGSKELLTLSVILIVLGTCWASEVLGLTLAMGAFIAGMILADSEFNHQIILDILPVKDYFAGIFFISVGMLLQVQLFFDSFFWQLGLAVGLIALKAILGFISACLSRSPIRISFIVGMRLAQIGEFSLILADMALDNGFFSDAQHQIFLTVSILSMLIAPLLVSVSTILSIKLFSNNSDDNADEEEEGTQNLSGHVVIAGYGTIGQNLSRVLREINIPFLVLDLDGERVKRALSNNMNALFGDSTREDTLKKAGIKNARMIVFSTPDLVSMQEAIRSARKLNPNLYILARTPNANQVEEMTEAGANFVIPEEFETSVEIFSRVLKEFHIPNNVIEQQVELIRLEGYSMLRGLSLEIKGLQKFSAYLTASLTESFQVMNESWANQKTLEDMKIKDKTGARLIAVVRVNDVHPNPSQDFLVQSGDIIVLFGRHIQLDQSLVLLESGPKDKQ
jgi:CPA2 family monovalent cation:H+ antiporter-2